MIGRVREIGGFRDSYDVSSGVGAYVGGSPMYVKNDDYSLEIATAALDTGHTLPYVGVAVNTKLYDREIGYDYARTGTTTGVTTVSRYRMAVIAGEARLRFTTGTKGNNARADGYPYQTGYTWVVGNPLYIGHNGRWANTGVSSFAIWGNTVTSGTAGPVMSAYTWSVKRGHVEAVGSTWIDVHLY